MEKREISVHIKDLSLDEKTLQDAIVYLQEALKDYKDQFKKLRINMITNDYDDYSSTDIQLIGDRLETDEELESRKKRVLKQEEETKNRELNLLMELMKKHYPDQFKGPIS